MATRMCDVCGIRPAVVAVRRRIPGQGCDLALGAADYAFAFPLT